MGIAGYAGYGVTPGNGPAGLSGLYGMIGCVVMFVVVIVILYFESDKRSKQDWYDHQFVHTNDSWVWFVGIFLLTVLVGVLIVLIQRYYFTY